MSTGATDPVDRGDLDGCLRRIDELVAQRDWDGLGVLRERCLAAYERGHQLWPAAHAAAHRLTLEAPAELAAQAVMLATTTRHFGLGPLTEVLGSRLTWAEVEPHLPPGPLRATVAEERIIRGEDLSDVEYGQHLTGTSPVLATWEPRYPSASYGAFEADFGQPPEIRHEEATSAPPAESTRPAERRQDDDVTEALAHVTAAWTEQSNGRCETVGVDGTAADAVRAFGVSEPRLMSITPATAMATMAWAAASGGAHGRRRGMAAGRFDAWWVAASACNLTDDWPVGPDVLGDALSELRWFHWHPGHAPQGWELHLAVEDPIDAMAWAIAAVDAD